jgi:hypothetical protein
MAEDQEYTAKILLYVPSVGGWVESNVTGTEYVLKYKAAAFAAEERFKGWTEVRIYIGEPAWTGHPSTIDWAPKD